MNRINNTVPEMRYDGKEDFWKWHTKCREKLIELLGLDHGFLIEGAAECIEIAKKLYEYAGCTDNVEHSIGELGHRFIYSKAYPILNKMLGR